MKLLRCIFAFLFLTSLLGLYAQTMEQGQIKMEVIEASANDPQMGQVVGAMKGTTQNISFDKSKQQIQITMMGGMMKMNIYQDHEDRSMETYMDMMGQKIRTVLSAEQMAAQEEESKEVMERAKLTEDKSDRKKILGYDCYKTTIEMESNGQAIRSVLYVTDKIKVPQTFIQNMQNLKLNGTPMEINMSMGSMKLTYQAVEISDKLPADFYKKPEGKYTDMDMEQLKKMGMGGQLGF